MGVDNEIVVGVLSMTRLFTIEFIIRGKVRTKENIYEWVSV